MAYLTLVQAKAFIGNETANDDTLIGEIIEDAQAFIESDSGAGRVFEAELDSTRIYDGTLDVANGVLSLDKDLCQITSITNGGVVLTTADYITDPRRDGPYFAISLRNGATWSAEPDGIEIVGRWAYSASVPNNIRRAMSRLVKWMYQGRDSNSDTDRPLVTDAGVTIMPSRVPADIMQLMYPYRKRL